MEVSSGPSVVGFLLTVGGTLYVLVGFSALGHRFAAPSDTDAGEPGT